VWMQTPADPVGAIDEGHALPCLAALRAPSASRAGADNYQIRKSAAP